MKKLLFVYNANAGKAQIKTHLATIIDIFIKEGYDVTVRPTQKKLDAYEEIRSRAGEFDLVVCSGGDGTLNESVNGIIDSGTDTRLGYIPSGTVNDFAVSLGIPKDMPQAAEIAVTGREFPCDIGMFNGRNFNYVAAFGLFTEVSYSTSQQKKNIFGHLAYVMEGAKSLSSVMSYRLRIEHDGEVIEDDFIFGMVSNSMSIGGMKGFIGEVSLDDGLFEASFIRMPTTTTELNRTLKDLARQDENSEYFYTFRAKNIKITSEELVSWTLDGEFGGHVKNADIKCNNKAVTFITSGDVQPPR